MNKSDSKQGETKPKAIIFSENSPLLPVTRQRLVKLCETLKRDKLTPWLWFNSRGVKVIHFDGATISMSGTPYGQSQALAFFSFIEPFLQDAIVKTLDETLETCRARGLKPEEPYIRETAMLLDGYLIDPIYRYMADIDRRIRGNGNPKSVARKDVTDEIAEMVKFLDKCKDEMIQGIKAENKRRVKTLTSGDKEKRKGILRRIPRWIHVLVIFLASLLTCIYLLWWLWTTFWKK